MNLPGHPIPPLLDAAALRAAGRTPPAPFRVALGGNRELLVLRPLRVLPGKRVVGEGEYEGRHVLVKLFIDSHSTRHWQRERRGIDAMTAAGIPTPPALGAEAIPGGGHVLLTGFLNGASTVLDAWRPLAAQLPGSATALEVLTPAFRLLGKLHAAGLSHDDLHLGNFLRHHDALHLIDGDAVRVHTERPLIGRRAARDLAMLIAQLPRTWDEGHLASFLEAYRSGGGHLPAAAVLHEALAAERAWRLRDYLSKTGRDCSLFRVERRFNRFVAVVRSEANALAPLLADPDRWMAQGTALKRGNTCTVARVDVGDRSFVVKRYNIKNARHALSRLWRPSRGWHSWREGHRLRLFGVATPAPLALIEERWGPLRGRAWLVTEYCSGNNLLAHLDADTEPPAAEGEAIRTLFATLHRARISHGDLKATNLLWGRGELKLIDLDAMRQHRSGASHARAWRRERARLLRNWPEGSVLYRWLNTVLPPSDSE